ncbi:MAG: cation transporter [Candidatus Poseidoniaceae archaeon]|jgi:copper chaperone CopZ|nr:cation transporter [Candidatus Poseidoniaceae archaeon]MDP6361795.1 cation transporter [Candidatus Poseidoniaceae archaeon]DAC21753.1 MAG TPA: hypothetical protein D7H89_03690 [Candidatus Poseidoniales archaeon]HII87040.1 hypothetical protein [Candidatus Poseidoniaceae archaeon]
MSQTIHTLSITGMTCGCCSGRVTRALQATPGVVRVLVSHEDHTGNILATPEVSVSTLINAVKSVGFDATA